MAPPGSQDQPPPDGRIYGPGPRVPMLVLSPRSRGGWVNSQVFDHTSVLQFWKSAFRCMNPTSARRRAVCGDLTSAFNFVDPNGEALPNLPATSRHAADGLRQRRTAAAGTAAIACPPAFAPPTSPGAPFPRAALPAARRGHRRGRTAPRDAEPVQYRRAGSGVSRLRSARSGADPRRFTVEAGKAVSDDWQTEDEYHLWLLGPNGFHRELRGALNRPQPEVRLRPTGRNLQLQLNNPGTEAIAVTLERCPYTQQGPWHITLPAGSSHQQRFDARASGGWYDLTLQSPGGWLRRTAGRLEDGEHSVSDPLMGGE